MPPASKRRKLKQTGGVQEITFDFAAREEYLTGFHKRKQLRIQHAQDLAAKKEKDERDRQRRELRKLRRDEVEAKVKAIEEYSKRNGYDNNAGGTEEEDEDEDGFRGFEDVPEPEQIDRMDEYIDEDRYAEVTIEDVDVSRDGLVKALRSNDLNSKPIEAEGDEDRDDDNTGEKKKPTTNKESINGSKKKTWAKEKPHSAKAKKKRKKFRYENREERAFTRIKERSKNKAQAKARRG